MSAVASAVPGNLLWTAGQLGDAMAALGRHAGFSPRLAIVESPSSVLDTAAVEAWAVGAARSLGLEIEPVEARYPEVESMLRRAAPALVQLPGAGATAGSAGYLAITGSRGKYVSVITPELTMGRCEVRSLRQALCGPLEAPHASAVESLLNEVDGAPRRRDRARRILLEQLLSTKAVAGCWLVRPADSAGLLAHLGGSTFVGRIVAVLGAQFVQYVLFMLAWGLIGWMALSDRFDGGWMALWLLLFAVVIPLRLYTYVAAGRISIDLGARLKRRYLDGALNLDPNQIRQFGAGQLLGRILEVEAIEQFTSSGALYLLIGVSELAFGAVVLMLGAGGWLHLAALAACVAVLAVVTVGYYLERSRWTESRMGITNGMVEQIVGHRTRLAQDPDGRWADRDDQALERHHVLSARLNRYEVAFQTAIPRMWTLVMIAALVPAFTQGTVSGGALAAAVGGVLIGYRAMTMIGHNLEQLVGALVAWKQLTPLTQAAGRADAPGLPLGAHPVASDEPAERPLLDARGIVFQHPGRREPVLRNACIKVFPRDRILVEGPSGEGKSTLASVLAACRSAHSGTVLLRGLDPETVGHRPWRRRVVHVPQFHENHVLVGSFAFNALMGRGWPATADDIRRARSVCEALGLGPLLERMPGGLFQMIGETGWQLSHGERSRLYVARALLQDPDITVLDESLSALDPETLGQTIDYLLESDSALVMIAHP